MNIKVFVIHYKKLVERREHILNEFKKYNISNYEFIEIDRNDIQQYDLSIFEDEFISKYKPPSVAILLSHIYAYSEIANNYDCGLIFEDDVILSPYFNNIFETCLKKLPNTYDMMFIGDGCSLHIPRYMLKEDTYIYRKGVEETEWGGNGCTRCVDSYLVSKKCASHLCNYIELIKEGKHEKINILSDWWLNIVGRELQFEVYWTEPTIVTQGSHNNTFLCSYSI
jgi:GR25 family glycosyltransferase involved in LPS biosynthesis